MRSHSNKGINTFFWGHFQEEIAQNREGEVLLEKSLTASRMENTAKVISDQGLKQSSSAGCHLPAPLNSLGLPGAHAHLRLPWEEGSASRSKPCGSPMSKHQLALATCAFWEVFSRTSSVPAFGLGFTGATELKREGDRLSETGRNEKIQSRMEGRERASWESDKGPWTLSPKWLGHSQHGRTWYGGGDS